MTTKTIIGTSEADFFEVGGSDDTFYLGGRGDDTYYFTGEGTGNIKIIDPFGHNTYLFSDGFTLKQVEASGAALTFTLPQGQTFLGYTPALQNYQLGDHADSIGYQKLLELVGEGGSLTAGQLPELQVEVPAQPITEAEGQNFTFYLRPSSLPQSPIEVTVTLSGSAVVDQDFTLPEGWSGLSQTITLQSNPPEGFYTLTFPVLNDDKVESLKSLQLTLSSPQNATLATNASSATITLQDGDINLSPVIMSPLIFSLPEKSPAKHVLGTILAEDGNHDTLTYSLAPSNDNDLFTLDQESGLLTLTAKGAKTLDYESQTAYSLQVEVSDGSTSTSESITVNLTNVDDTPPIVAPGQYFEVPENSLQGVIGTILVTDADTPPEQLQYAIVEGNEDGYFALDPKTGALSITSAGESAPLDFETTSLYTLTLQASDGIQSSATENIQIGLTDLPDGLPELSIQPASVVEGNSGVAMATLIFTLSKPSTQSVSVNYATVDGTAQMGSDYAPLGGTITFTPGITSRLVTIPIISDNSFELEESFTLKLTSPSGMILVQNQVSVTIENDDPLPILSLGALEATENSQAALATITLNTPSTLPTIVTYETRDGTAHQEEDYQAITGKLTITAGQSSVPLTIPLLDNTESEETETFQLVLTQVTGGEFPSGLVELSTMINILDNDKPSGKISGTTGNDTLQGTDGPDTIIGFEGDDSLLGGEGDDVLWGLSGYDTLVGGSGNDILEGSTDIDSADYRDAPSPIEVNLNNNIVLDGFGYQDILHDIENILGSPYDDVITGQAGDNQLDGQQGNDSIAGYLGNDTLVGGEGRDSLDGGAGLDMASYRYASSGTIVDLGSSIGVVGSDTLVASLGELNNSTGLLSSATSVSDISSLVGSSSLDSLTVLIATADMDRLDSIENIEGSQFDDQINGSRGNNTLYGREGHDLLGGIGGDDLLIGGAGNDSLLGGTGFDITSYSEAPSAIGVNLSIMSAQDGEGGNDLLQEIEGIEGSPYDDKISGDDQGNWLAGNAGNDTLQGAGGNDIFYGGSGADSLNGGTGNDTIDYSGSLTPITANLATGEVDKGLQGIDHFTSIEEILGSAFHDLLQGSNGADYLLGGKGDDSVLGGGSLVGLDTLVGGAGNDTLEGIGYVSYAEIDSDLFLDSEATTGVDVDLSLGLAHDGENGVDILRGITSVRGSLKNDILIGNADSNILEGGSGDDQLVGSDGADQLLGGLGNDTLNGGAQADTLDGGIGQNQLTGGAGADTFLFMSAALITGDNTIVDFEDSLDFVEALETSLIFLGESTSFDGTVGAVMTQRQTTTTLLLFDLDGNGQSDGQLTLLGIHHLSSANFSYPGGAIFPGALA